ncbi:MAG: hypothetical protein IPM86_16310 [Saprospiraceae bacterium]|nr:hypothetical protein [Saprospiraceae bacterium]
MKNILLSLAIFSSFFFSCHSHSHNTQGGHSNDEHGNHTETTENKPEALVYTIYTEKTELFLEHKPLIAGQECRFAAHFTALGELFTAVDEGTITLTLSGPNGSQSSVSNKPEVPGIFRLRLTPEKIGIYSLVFDIKTPSYTDKITIQNVEVFQDEKKLSKSKSRQLQEALKYHT